MDQEGGRGETEEDQSGPANRRETPRRWLDASRGQQPAAGIEDRQKQKAADEQQMEETPSAANVETGKDRRVYDEHRAE